MCLCTHDSMLARLRTLVRARTRTSSCSCSHMGTRTTAHIWHMAAYQLMMFVGLVRPLHEAAFSGFPSGRCLDEPNTRWCLSLCNFLYRCGTWKCVYKCVLSRWLGMRLGMRLDIRRSTDPPSRRAADLPIHQSAEPSIHRATEPPIHCNLPSSPGAENEQDGPL